MKAKLIKTLRINGKAVRPVEGKVVLVDLDDTEFKRLEANGTVAEPTADDLKLAGVESAEKPKRGPKPKGDETKTETETGSGEGGTNPTQPNPDDL